MCDVYISIRSDVGMGVSAEVADEDSAESKRAALLKEIDKCIGGINGLLTDAGFEIKLAVMGGGKRFYVFVNTQADTLAKNFGSKLTAEEMGFFRAGVDAIIAAGGDGSGIGGLDDNDNENDGDEAEKEADKENGGSAVVGSKGKIGKSQFIAIRTSMAALVYVPTVSAGGGGEEDGEGGGEARSSLVKGKPVTAKRAEKLVETFVEDGWLARRNRDNLSLGVRTYAELGDLCRSLGLSSLPQMVTLR